MPELSVLQPQPSTALTRLVDAYLAHCRAAGLSPKTIRHAYGYSLRGIFLPWCAEHGIERPEQLTRDVLDSFVADLLENGGKRGQLSKYTAWTYAKAAKRLLAWAAGEGEPVDARVTLPKLPRKLVDTLSREEIQVLEETASSERDALIVRLLADTGMRVGELVGLRVRDVGERDRHNFVKVRGQGG